MVRGVTRLVESDEDVLISGGGDGTIKLWKLFQDQNRGIEELACLGEDDAESVLSMAVDGSFLYSSKLEGVIELWDLDTKQKLRVIRAHKGDVMTLQMGWGYLWSAGSTGFARVSLLAFLGPHFLSMNAAEIQYSSIWQVPELNIVQSKIPLREQMESPRGSDPGFGSHTLQRPTTVHHRWQR
jgi:WD40 repeat protein